MGRNPPSPGSDDSPWHSFACPDLTCMSLQSRSPRISSLANPGSNFPFRASPTACPAHAWVWPGKAGRNTVRVGEEGNGTACSACNARWGEIIGWVLVPPDDGIGPSDQRYPFISSLDSITIGTRSALRVRRRTTCFPGSITPSRPGWVVSIELTPSRILRIYPNHGALTASIKVLPPEEPRLKDVEITAAACLIHLPHGPRSRRSVSRSAISERGGVAVEINDAAIQSRPAESGTPVPTAVMLSLRMPDWSVVYTGQRAFKS